MTAQKNILNAFTLLELMVVMVILGVIASLVVPQFKKTIERGHEREAARNLTMIHAAEQVYLSSHDTYWPGAGSHTLAEINSNLRLNIIENGMTYTCTGAAAPSTTFTCTAVRQAPSASFTVTVTQAAISATNPQCTAGACP